MKYFFTTFLFILGFSMFGISQTSADDFVTVWNLSNLGTGPNQIKFSIQSDREVSYTWATIPSSNSGAGVLTNGVNTISGLPTGATIELRIQPINLNSFSAADGTQNSNNFDYKRLIEIKQWGTVQWKNFRKSFIDCENLVLSTTDLPVLSSCTDMSEMFRRCKFLVATDNISNWDVSNVTDMFRMFSGATSFNKNISNWNVSNVTNMSFMFYGNTYFNSDIENWNVGKVTNMSSMFAYAKNFNGNLSNWNVTNVTDMNNMFANATNFNGNINNWTVAKVTDMSLMFSFASAFNKDISNWEITNVLNMSGMFKYSYKFNQNLEKWILKLNPEVNMIDIFSYSGFNNVNYDKFLIGLDNSSLLGRPLGTNTLEFCSASAQRMSLISKGWTISGDTQYCPSEDFVIILNGLKLNGISSSSLKLNIEGSGSIKYSWTAINEGASGIGYLTNGINYIEELSTFSKVEFRVNSKNLLHFKMEAGSFFYIGVNSPSVLLDIKQWGNAKWKSFEQSFINCQILNITATDIPNLSNCTSLKGMFMNCYKLTGPTNINNWNVSNISNMVNMFANAKNFNQDLSDWNINKVTDMSGMFYSAIRFNQNLSKWGSKINPAVNMSKIFDYSALDLYNYDAIINSFDISGITGRNLGANTMSFCNSLIARNNLIGKGWNIIGDELQCNPALNDFVTLWDLSKPGSGSNQIKIEIQNSFNLSGGELFYSWTTIPSGPSGKGSFYIGDNIISGLPSGKTIELRIKYLKLETFKVYYDQLRLIDIKQWGKATWTNFYNSFSLCENLDISATDLPDLSNCTNTAFMFNQCSSLNGPQNINLWNVSNIKNMDYMFSSAENFNKNLGDWGLKLNPNVNLEAFLVRSGLSQKNYDATLKGFDVGGITGRK
jgi:trimeric autotransporter adhesin